jgi:hypothetical protein
MSTKSKSPWITYNGEDVADSEFAIDYLNKKMDIDVNKHLTAEQKAVAKAFQRLVEDNLYWSVITSIQSIIISPSLIYKRASRFSLFCHVIMVLFTEFPGIKFPSSM